VLVLTGTRFCRYEATFVTKYQTKMVVDHHGRGDEPVEPPRPLGAWLLDQLLLFSPRTWWGLLLFLSNVPFAPLDLKSMMQSIMGILLPLLLIAATLPLLKDQISQHPMLPIQNHMGFLSCYMLSPWTIACAVELLSELRTFGFRLHNYRTRRLSPLPEAVACLQQRVTLGRAIRYRRFDVYLPESPSTTQPTTRSTSTALSSTNQQPPQRVILFLPGFLVSHVAYSLVAAQLSDEGFMVVVWSMEPWRMAYRHLGADPSRMAHIQHFLRRNNVLPPKPNHRKNAINNASWALMGHSMGSFAAMRLAAGLWRTTTTTRSFWRSAEIPDQLVMWGAASFPGWTTPLASNKHVRILVLQGSCDGFYRSTFPNRAQFLQDFAECQTKHVLIQGANHANFGSYSLSTTSTIDATNQINGWDQATISRQKQQTLACRLTTQFLKQSKR
jgi:hypothetical protein